MPGAIIVIDQVRPGPIVSPGTPGVARDDLWLSNLIQLHVGVGGNTSYFWQLLDVPPGSAVGASLGTAATASFTPDLSGAYRLQLITNGGGPGNQQILKIGVRYDAVGVLVNRGWCPPALGEVEGEDNVGGSVRGYARSFEFMLADIRTTLDAGGGSGAPGVQDIAALRAVPAINRSDKQIRLVEDEKRQFFFDTTTGAGIEDNGKYIIRPTDVLLAANGRWYALPETNLEEIEDRVVTLGWTAGPDAPVPTQMIGISAHRGDIAGVARDRAVMVWDEPSQQWIAGFNTGADDSTMGERLGIEVLTLRTNPAAGATGSVLIRDLVGTGTFGAVYMGDAQTTAPTGSNYSFASDGQFTVIGSGASGIYFRTDFGSTRATLSSTGLALYVPLITVSDVVVSPSILQLARASDAIPYNFTLMPQWAFAGATGANRTSGSLLVDLGAPAGAGTAEARLTIYRGGTFSASIGPYESAGSVYSAVYMGPGITPSTTNFAFLGNGVDVTYLNTPIGGALVLAFGGGSNTDGSLLIMSTVGISWSQLSTNPVLSQTARTTDSAPVNMTIKPQWAFATATGANRTPGSLILSLGAPQNAGATEARVQIKRDGTSVLSMGALDGYATSYGVIWAGYGVAPTGSNWIFLSNGSTLTQINSVSGAMELCVNATTKFAVSATLATVSVPLQLQGAGSATVGDIRASNGTQLLVARNLAGDADFAIIDCTGGANSVYFRTTGGTMAFYAGNTVIWQADTSQVSFDVPTLQFDRFQNGVVTTGIRFEDSPTLPLKIAGQTAWASATGTNRNAGALTLSAGAATDTNGLKGSVSIALNNSFIQHTMIDVRELQVEVTAMRRVIALFSKATITTTEMPASTGDLVLWVGNAASLPVADPVGGYLLWVDSGTFKGRGTSGTVTTIGAADLEGFKDTSGHGHCPVCHTDFAHEWVNSKWGHSLTVCMKCLTDEIGDRPWIVRKAA